MLSSQRLEPVDGMPGHDEEMFHCLLGRKDNFSDKVTLVSTIN